MTMTRKDFIAGAAGAGVSAAASAAGIPAARAADTPATSGSAALPLSLPTVVDPEWEAARQELIGPFVIACHGDLDAVKAGLAAEPRLSNARFFKFDEAPIEAAAHMGRADIAHWLLGSGAPLTIHSAVMLGLRDVAAAYLTREPALAMRPGAHGIAMMYHAAYSGDTAVTQLLVDHGGGRDYGEALHAAIVLDRVEMVRWLIAQGAEIGYPNFREQTPLAVAEQLGHAGIAALLRGAGAV
jgi:ankyrin repeat protein